MSKVDLKVVILGKSGIILSDKSFLSLLTFLGIGKTCLIKRYVNGFYHQDEGPTVGASYFCKRVNVGNSQVVLGIWDTAGQERFDSMTKIYYRGAEAAIVGYDLTDRHSFERAKFWIEELNSNVEKCKIYLVGTKVDLIEAGEPRGMPEHEITAFAHKVEASAYIETSAKTGHEITSLFEKIAQNWLNDHPQTAKHTPNATIDPNQPNQPAQACEC